MGGDLISPQPEAACWYLLSFCSADLELIRTLLTEMFAIRDGGGFGSECEGSHHLTSMLRLLDVGQQRLRARMERRPMLIFSHLPSP